MVARLNPDPAPPPGTENSAPDVTRQLAAPEIAAATAQQLVGRLNWIAIRAAQIPAEYDAAVRVARDAWSSAERRHARSAKLRLVTERSALEEEQAVIAAELKQRQAVPR